MAATNRDAQRAYYSNYGSVVDVAAPGGAQSFANDPNGILSTLNSGETAPESDNYENYQGTSMATPHVAGVAALLYSLDPDAPASYIEAALLESAREFPGACDGCGLGLVDAAQSVAFVRDQQVPKPQADLGIHLRGKNGQFKKENDDDPLGYIRYEARVTNNGPTVPTQVVLTNVFPAEVNVVQMDASQGNCDFATGVCELGELEVDGLATVLIEVTTANEDKMDFTAKVADADTFDIERANDEETRRFGGALIWLLALSGLMAAWRLRYQRA